MAAKQCLPSCPDPLPADLASAVECLASLWATHPDRPRIEAAVIGNWEKLITDWIGDKQLPLLIRKSGNGGLRGEKSCHKSCRGLVRADNSPAWWSCALAFSGKCPSISDIHDLFERDQIPFALTLTQQEKAHSTYKCTSKILRRNNPNKLGWKVCHRTAIGLSSNNSIEQMPIENLEKHFRQFISPSNMFLIPKKLGGLGELPQFICAIGDGV